MTKQTKLELVQINARLAQDNADLREQIAGLQLNVEMLVCAHADAEADLAKAKGSVVRAPRPAYVMPAWQQERAAAMAAAKAAAMAAKCVVRV